MAISPLHRNHPKSPWLNGLILTKKLTLATAIALTAGLLAVYARSVHTQANWNQQYQQLELLRRQERKLTATMETLENNLVTNLQRYPGNLVKKERSQLIYLPLTPASNRETRALIAPPTPDQPIRGY